MRGINFFTAKVDSCAARIEFFTTEVDLTTFGITYFSSSFRPAFKLSKFKIVLKTRK